MKILSVTPLAIADVKVVRFARFCDQRGYFSEHFRSSDFASHPDLAQAIPLPFVQCNEAFSRRGTLRGLHFHSGNPRWASWCGPSTDDWSTLRSISGPARRTFGQSSATTCPRCATVTTPSGSGSRPALPTGTLLPEETVIEYFCTAAWNPAAEAGISPLAPDLSWWLSDDPALRALYQEIAASGPLLADKDRNAPTLTEWQADPRAALVTG